MSSNPLRVPPENMAAAPGPVPSNRLLGTKTEAMFKEDGWGYPRPGLSVEPLNSALGGH